MAKNVEIQMDGLKKRLTKMRKNLSNPSPAMQKTSLFMYKDIQDHFNKGTGPRGGWKPLKYRTGKTLQDTGALRNSVEASNTKDSAKVSAGNAQVDYAGYQNNGTSNIPQRKFLWLSKDMRGTITKLIGKFFVGK